MHAPTSSRPATGKSRKAFWLKQLHMWHWMSSAVSLIGLLLFAVTGFTLNHAADIEATPVVTEAAWLLRKRPDALYKLFTSFEGGLFALLTLDADDLPATAALMKRYESSGLQFADAALAHLAERENIRTVFTTDRRDFSLIRLKRNRTLRLIPDLP